MLALTRKKGEALIIDGQIEIRIIEVQGDKVRIGINAPNDVSIYREEVYKLVKESNQEAVSAGGANIQILQQMIDSYRK